MSNVTISPNMSLTIPVTGQEPGPDWANDINNSLSVIDAHNHAPGSGVQITPQGMNINADMTFNSNNAISLRSARYTVNASPLAGVSDLSCGYAAGTNGDLYWNDGLGNQIRITQSGSVAGSSGTITGLPSGTASAAYVAGSGTFVFQQATSTAANFDVASIAIRYPGSYPTPAGNYIQLQAPSSLATGYSITLPANLPATSGAFLTESTAGVVSYTNVDNSSLAITTNVLAIKAQGVAQSALALRSTGTTVGAGGIALSSSSGFFGTSSITDVPVTNLSVTITTLGRPVFVGLVPDGDAINGSYVGTSNSGTFSIGYVSIYRAGSQIFTSALEVSGASGNLDSHVPCGSVFSLDLVAAGTYTYSIQIRAASGIMSTLAVNCKLVAYEI